MSNRKRKCKGCHQFGMANNMVIYGLSAFCDDQCRKAFTDKAVERTRAKNHQKLIREVQEQDKAFKRETKRRKQAQVGRLDLYKILGKLVNQYVKHIHRNGDPCYTCDKPQSPTDAPQAFHAGHFKAAKQVDPRRFMIEQIRVQCYKCNSVLSGNQAEYRRRLQAEHGDKWVEWIEADCEHKTLDQRYPELDDIRSEIARYRNVIRDKGLSPNG